jgi:hypothetical protein
LIRALIPVTALLIVWPQPGQAQDRCFGGSVDDPGGCRFEAPRWAGEVASLGANAMIGGLTAGLVQHFRGGSFRDGFTKGVSGGALVYAGKRAASERFAGAGAIGRIVAAAGSSVVRNAGQAAPLFAHLTLPLGPVWMEVQTRTRSVSARVDPAALAWTLYGVIEPELEIDWGRTLSSAAPVFRTDGKLLELGNDSVHAAGLTNAGVIFLADIPAFGPSYADRYAAHERVHVLQEDQLAIQWTDPAASWAVQRIPLLRNVNPHIAVNLSTEILRVFGGFISQHGDRPWELESIFFAR